MGLSLHCAIISTIHFQNIFIMLKGNPLPIKQSFPISSFSQGCWILSNAFSASLDGIMWIFFFEPVNKVDYIDFHIVKQLLYLWNKTHLVIGYNCFYILLNSICQHCCCYLYLYSWGILDCSFLPFLYCLSLVLCQASISNYIGKSLFLFSFLDDIV